MSAWELVAECRDEFERWDAWAAFLSSTASWPHGTLRIERRLIVSERGSLRELLLIAADGSGIVATRRQLHAELRHLARPLLARRSMDRLNAPALRAALSQIRVGDAVQLDEIGAVSRDQDEHATSFQALLATLMHSRGATSVSLLVTNSGRDPDDSFACPASPGRPAGGAPWGLPAVVRVVSSRRVGPALLAHCASWAGDMAAADEQQWTRAHRPQELAAAQCASRELALSWIARDAVPASIFIDDLIAVAAMPCPAHALARAGRRSRKTGAAIGIGNDPLGNHHTVRLAWEQRKRHVLVVGATGTGKSTLLGHLIRDDLHAGRGLIVFDPHRDLAEAVLGTVPASRRADVVVIDPADPASAKVDLIPAAGDGRDDARLADAFVEAFDADGRQQFVGPIFHRQISNAVAALRASTRTRGAVTLASVERFLVDESFGVHVARGVEDPLLRSHIDDDHRLLHAPRGDSNLLAYITSKLTRLLRGPVGSIFDAPARYRIEDLIADGKILICVLPVGELGFETAQVAGRLVVSRVLGAVAAQSTIRPVDRAPVSLVFDEAQLLTGGLAIERLLSQGRKFGAAVTLANQAPSQLGSTLASITMNAGTVAMFRLGAREAAHFADRVESDRLRLVPQLPRFTALVTTDEDGPLGSVTLRTTAPPQTNRSNAARTRAVAGRQWGSGDSPGPILRHGGNVSNSPRDDAKFDHTVGRGGDGVHDLDW